ncbi:TPA: hypothetical protein HA242_00270 [Candidatus Woesearchaeota archaeon]|nr:hypothetical protein [Candidatus Woesearchaeota archaeon]HIH12139.1 hypothetical protein [Candidatus Woesearchaeota archaeon]
MTKLPLFIITTDFDWTSDTIGHTPQETIERHQQFHGRVRSDFDILDKDFYSFGGPALEKKVQEFRSGNIFPCMELRPDYFSIHFKPGLYLINPIPNNQTLQDIILLQDSSLRGDVEKIQAGLPPGTLHLDLLFNFYSNEGKYDPVIQQLKQDFEVAERSIRRTNYNYRLEGVSEPYPLE